MTRTERTRTGSRRRLTALLVLAALAIALGGVVARAVSGSGYTVIGWNNLGMHCMDADYGVFAILPPYNTVQAQVVDPSGALVTGASGVTVTYQGVADPTGSINTTSAGKTNFWQHVLDIFGASLAVDQGLAGFNMPGTPNTPQALAYDPTFTWFGATGVPITPYDNTGAKNPYPMMQITAKNSSGTVLATTNVVLPISDEMDCKACHASGSGPAAMPAAGWVYDPDPQRDFRLNVIRLHDDRQASSSVYQAALAARGLNAGGLYPTVVTNGKAILCATCHASEALSASGYPGVPPLTQSMHTLHGTVVDPTNGQTLNASTNRTACYRCHPGSATRCLRGVMGNAVAIDGTMEIQCQNCHGPMSAVGAGTRTGWFNEPSCQQCHTGTATSNNGQIRYTSAFDTTGQPRVPVDPTFATTANTPAAGLDLYRFSSGHGGIQCAGCHGSTHAEYPSSHPNDNIQNVSLQGHVGMIAECAACHVSVPNTTNGGPHGMHPLGQSWVSAHQDAADSGGRAACQACHGTDYRGTVLSRVFADRTISAFGTKTFWRGFQVGCYTCHNGPSNDNGNSNHAPAVQNLSASTPGTPVQVALQATDADGNALALRIVSQPSNGTAGLSGTTATYFPFAGFTGTDSFTYAANDGQTDSNLGQVTVTVAGSGCSLSCSASGPSSATVGTPVSFTSSVTVSSGCTGTPTYDWDFGDGTPHSSAQDPNHTYATAGTFNWAYTSTLSSATCTQVGTITISSGAGCSLSCSATVPSSGTVGQAVSFQSSSSASSACTGSPSYQWAFGDGGTSSNQNPAHTYASAGNYAWTLTVAQSGQTCVHSGSISITGGTPAPTISRISSLTNPFRIKIQGDHFLAGVRVYIGSDTSPWGHVTRQDAQDILLGGSNLSAKFPRGQQVTIKIVNPDGQFAVGSFTRGKHSGNAASGE